MPTSQVSQEGKALSHGPSKEEWEVAHETLRNNPVLWERLQFRGIFGLGNVAYESRGCPYCDSTINKAVRASDALLRLTEVCALLLRSLESMPTVVCSD